MDLHNDYQLFKLKYHTIIILKHLDHGCFQQKHCLPPYQFVTILSFIVQMWLTFVAQIVQSSFVFFFLHQNPISGLEVLQSIQTLKILHVTSDLHV